MNSCDRRRGTLATIRRSAAAAVGQALADGIELVEVEFPPLIETKSQFDDFSNVEELDANRDFGVQLALEPEIVSVAPGEKLWLCFADDGEAKLAREAWPGKRYAEATQTSIAGAIGARRCARSARLRPTPPAVSQPCWAWPASPRRRLPRHRPRLFTWWSNRATAGPWRTGSTSRFSGIRARPWSA